MAKKKSKTTDKTDKTRPTAKAVFAEMLPAGIGLNLVLSILESITLSFHIFNIAEHEAPLAISKRETHFIQRHFSDRENNIAHTAVTITKDITHGLLNT